MRRKRILLLDRFYFPDEQPTSVYLTELTQALGDSFEWEVLCGPPLLITEETQPTPPPSQIHQVPSLRLPKRLLWGRILNDLSFLLAAFWRGFFIPKFDLVVSQTSPPGIWWIGFLLSRRHRARWVHICKDVFPENLKAIGASSPPGLFSLLERADSFLLKKADRILVIGEDMRENFLKKGFPSKQIFRSYDWVDLEFIRPLSKRNSFSEKHQLADRFVVLYAGNFGRVHNFEDFLDAAQRLRSHPEILFVLMGEGALKEHLIREARSRRLSNLLILPFEPRTRLPEVLASADASVILLRKGMAGLSVPSKIYSILASGRPILACVEKASDIAQMVRESNSGFLIPPGNPDEFCRRVVSLYENQTLRNQLGLNARRFAEEQDFQTRAFRNYEQVFREALDGHEKAV